MTLIDDKSKTPLSKMKDIYTKSILIIQKMQKKLDEMKDNGQITKEIYSKEMAITDAPLEYYKNLRSRYSENGKLGLSKEMDIHVAEMEQSDGCDGDQEN